MNSLSSYTTIVNWRRLRDHMSASSLDDKWFQLVSYKYNLHRLKAFSDQID